MAKSHFVESLERIDEATQTRDLSIQEIFELLGEKSHLILILFFSVPFLQPVPLMGLSTPLGTLIVIVSYYLLIHKPPWLPKRFCDLKVSKTILSKTLHLIEKIWSYLETVLKPRWSVFYSSPIFRLVNFVLVSTSAILLALPLPIPFTNTVPTVPIVLNMIGQLEEDGAIIFLSFCSFLFSVVFFTGLALLGTGIFVEINKYFDKIIPLLGF